MQHLEKNGMNNLTRDHFSFSTKIFIGEFLKPTGQRGDDGEEKYLRLNEQEMLDDVDKIRKENGWKPLKRSFPPAPGEEKKAPPPKKAHLSSPSPAPSSSSPTPVPSAASPASSSTAAAAAAAAAALSSLLPTMTPEQKMLARLQAEIQLREQQAQRQEELRLQKEAMRYIREAERLEKLEAARREREARKREEAEAKRRRQEELQRQRQEENLKRLQEKELKRQQAALAKEQVREAFRAKCQSHYTLSKIKNSFIAIFNQSQIPFPLPFFHSCRFKQRLLQRLRLGRRLTWGASTRLPW